MAKPSCFSLSNLQVGMHFTGALSNRRGDIILAPYHPIQHEHIADWTSSHFEEIYTYGFLIENISDLRHIHPGYTDAKLAQCLDMYYRSLNIIKGQFLGSFSRLDMELIQKTASQWTDLLVKEQDPHLLLKVLRYASPLAEDYFFSHALDVSILATALLFRTERSTVRMMQIAVSGILFDIGMLKLPEEYRIPGADFTPEMRKELQKHPIYGYQIITQDFKIPPVFGLAALEHHERFDGSGYPRQLSGIRISQYAAIIGLADIFTAQIRERPGRPAKEPAEILKDFVATTLNRFSQELVGGFLNFLTIYPVTSILMLNTGETALVTETFSYAPLRPTVMILCNADGSYDPSRRIVHLSEEENDNIKISGVFNRTLLQRNTSIHIKPVLSYDLPPSQNPNLQNISAERFKGGKTDDESKEISIRL